MQISYSICSERILRLDEYLTVDVTLIEGARAPGGLAASQSIGGYTWDRFYHVILLSDTHLRSLLEELGFGDRLRWGVTRTGFYTDGHLYSLSTSLEFLRFPPLSLWPPSPPSPPATLSQLNAPPTRLPKMA